MSYKYKKEKYRSILCLIVAGMLLALAIYAAGCLPFYIYQKSEMMKGLYSELEEMELDNLEDDDKDTLDEYRKEKIGLLIVNEKFETVYSSRNTFSARFIKKQIEDRLDDFAE